MFGTAKNISTKVQSPFIALWNIYGNWFNVAESTACVSNLNTISGKHNSIGLPIICKNRNQHCFSELRLRRITMLLYWAKWASFVRPNVSSPLYRRRTSALVKHTLTRFHWIINAGRWRRLAQTFWNVFQYDGEGKQCTHARSHPLWWKIIFKLENRQ